jgi:hypothetical protein
MTDERRLMTMDTAIKHDIEYYKTHGVKIGNKTLTLDQFKSTIKSMYKTNPVTHWKMSNGKYIAIKDMTDLHLTNTIAMLRRQIDGSAHDDFCHDNIIAMENELKRRRKMKIQNVDLKVVGVTFTNEDTGEKRSTIIKELAEVKKPEEITITLEREKDNKYDMNAVKVLADDKQIGYIGKEYASIIAPLMDEYEEFTAVVKGIGTYKNRPYCEITINQV